MIGNKYKKEQAGFSLLEMLVSVSLFIIIVISSTEIFRLTLEGQRTAVASQNVQSSLKYFYELISKELRMAIKSTGECGVPSGDIYQIEAAGSGYGQKLLFKNYHDECVIYEIVIDEDNNSKRFKITRSNPNDASQDYSGFLSPNRIDVQDLQFLINNAISAEHDNEQSSITINMTARPRSFGEHRSAMNIQTTVTSRYYK